MDVRIGIVDDHPTTVLGVAALIAKQPELRLVGSGATARELLASARSFDVVLLDLSLSDGSSPAENLRRLRASTAARVLVFTSGDRPQLIREAARHGAIGMIRKSSEAGELLAAIRAAARGEVVASVEWAAALEFDPVLRAQLTERETQVLALYAAGETAERVGEQLFISRETVVDHVRRIRAKYAAVDRPATTKVQLYRRAVEDGIIEERKG